MTSTHWWAHTSMQHLVCVTAEITRGAEARLITYSASLWTKKICHYLMGVLVFLYVPTGLHISGGAANEDVTLILWSSQNQSVHVGYIRHPSFTESLICFALECLWSENQVIVGLEVLFFLTPSKAYSLPPIFWHVGRLNYRQQAHSLFIQASLFTSTLLIILHALSCPSIFILNRWKLTNPST